MSKSIRWSDGTEWSVADSTFDHAIQCLDAVVEPIWGLEPLLGRLKQLAKDGSTVSVDGFAPSEEDRSIVTAGLDRALEHARRAGAEALGFDEPRDYTAFMEKLGRLHELFMTDVTHKPTARRLL